MTRKKSPKNRWRNRRLRVEALESRQLLATVTIDPGAYGGNYNLAGQGPFVGATSLDLDPGTYSIAVAPVSTSIGFEVDSSGNVISHRPTSALGSGNTLTFNNTTTIIDPGAYTGTYILLGITAPLDGVQSVVLVPDIGNYGVRFNNSLASVTFDLDAAGQVVSNDPTSVQGVGDTLQFLNSTVTIDPGAYTGTYSLPGITAPLDGLQSVVLVPDIGNYGVRFNNSLASVTFDLDAAGQVTSNDPASVQGVGDTLQFLNSTVTIDAGAYTGTYILPGITAPLNGTRDVVLVPDIGNYGVRFNNSLASVTFDVDAAGQVTSNDPASVQGMGDTLQFLNASVRIDPSTYSGGFSLPGITSLLSGPQCIVLVPGISGYQLRVNGPPITGFTFDVDASGQPDPTSVIVALDDGSHAFSLSDCGIEVLIDIKPGEDPNPINLGVNGTVPVAILSSDTFDATTVDPGSVTLADAAVNLRGNGTLQAAAEDVNGDGLLDLVVHVQIEGLTLTEGDTQAVLTGETFDGVAIRGTDTVRVIAALMADSDSTIASLAGAGQSLTLGVPDQTIARAIDYWRHQGTDEASLNALANVSFRVEDLSDSLLGLASRNTIVIDSDAAGFGWSIHPGSSGFDLSSAVAHELGHVLGFDHDLESGVMSATMSPASTTLLAPVRRSALDSRSHSLMSSGISTQNRRMRGDSLISFADADKRLRRGRDLLLTQWGRAVTAFASATEADTDDSQGEFGSGNRFRLDSRKVDEAMSVEAGFTETTSEKSADCIATPSP